MVPAGRGFQLRAGAYEARSEYIMFIHGDSVLPEGYNEAAFRCLQHPGVVAGAFRFAMDIVHRYTLLNNRTKLDSPYHSILGTWWFCFYSFVSAVLCPQVFSNQSAE